MTGNLKSRDLHGTEEHFFYDTDGKQLNRLAGIGPDEYTVSETYAFADNGNITEKQGVGEYVYHPEKKNAVTQIDIPELGQNQDLVQFVSYNHFNSVSEIKNLDDQTRVDLEYGADDQRRMAKYWDESGAQDELIKTRLYAGAYEKQTNADLTEIEVHYISAGGQLAAMYVVENGVGSYYYPHQDHLGSIIHITDANGDIVYTQSFDPWGRTRNPNDLTYDNIPTRLDWLWRGYTGHEHLDEFGLINMNGRLYDPVVGRMLSPDNYVQNPDFSQSYNRYSYVWNNPLKYTDPSGEWVGVAIAAGALIGAYIGGSAAEGNWDPTMWNWDGRTLGGMFVGGAIGAAAGYGFAMAAPIIGGTAATTASAGSGLGAVFGASGVVAGYTLTGIAAGGLAGYGAGFFGDFIGGGTWSSAHRSGMGGAQFGSAAGGILGGISGLVAGSHSNPPPRSVIDGQPIEFDPIINTDNGNYDRGELFNSKLDRYSNLSSSSIAKQGSIEFGPLEMVGCLDCSEPFRRGPFDLKDSRPWLIIPGPYDGGNWRSNWMNIMAYGNHLDSRLKGPEGLDIYLGMWGSAAGFVLDIFHPIYLPVYVEGSEYYLLDRQGRGLPDHQ